MEYKKAVEKIKQFYAESSEGSPARGAANPVWADGKNFAYGIVLDLLGEEKPNVNQERIDHDSANRH